MRRRIAIVVSDPTTVKAFLRDQIRALGENYEVTVFANSRNAAETGMPNGTVRLQSVAIEREIAPWRDLAALWHTVRWLRRGGFDVVHSVTPKAGLIAMLGGRLAGVPHRIHTFTGQVWVTRHGASRLLLRSIDRLISRFATTVLIDSPSQRDFLLAQRVVEPGKSRVLGDGSIAGVDTGRFRPDPDARRVVRTELGIGDATPLLLYVGRLKRDKGVLDLARACVRLRGKAADSVLLIVGRDEEGLRAGIESEAAARRDQLRFVDHTDAPERYMAAADIFCLPSYREGFGGVVIEAAACAVPAVGSRIYGISDSIVDGQTGLLHAPGDIAALSDHLQRLVENDALRRRLGQAARERALRRFPMKRLTSEVLALYRALLD